MHVRIVRDRGTGQSRGFGFVVSILQQLSCPFLPFIHWMHASLPSGITSHVSNTRQHCLHLLVHAVFAGRSSICLELLACLKEELLVLLRTI